ncbi:MAG: hypothetical protein QM541_13370 [Flavobacterium sp.]|nr:hypothetical protein [Flavobacterium sp.]
MHNIKRIAKAPNKQTAFALTAKGFKPAFTTQLQTLKKSIADENAQQQLLQSSGSK